MYNTFLQLLSFYKRIINLNVRFKQPLQPATLKLNKKLNILQSIALNNLGTKQFHDLQQININTSSLISFIIM